MPRTEPMQIEKRRDRPGGRFRLYPVGDSAEAWKALIGNKRQKANRDLTIQDYEVEALQQLGVKVRITELGE